VLPGAGAGDDGTATSIYHGSITFTRHKVLIINKTEYLNRIHSRCMFPESDPIPSLKHQPMSARNKLIS
jgi:hypothetical protein